MPSSPLSKKSKWTISVYDTSSTPRGNTHHPGVPLCARPRASWETRRARLISQKFMCYRKCVRHASIPNRGMRQHCCTARWSKIRMPRGERFVMISSSDTQRRSWIWSIPMPSLPSSHTKRQTISEYTHVFAYYVHQRQQSQTIPCSPFFIGRERIRIRTIPWQPFNPMSPVSIQIPPQPCSNRVRIPRGRFYRTPSSDTCACATQMSAASFVTTPHRYPSLRGTRRSRWRGFWVDWALRSLPPLPQTPFYDSENVNSIFVSRRRQHLSRYFTPIPTFGPWQMSWNPWRHIYNRRITTTCRHEP